MKHKLIFILSVMFLTVYFNACKRYETNCTDHPVTFPLSSHAKALNPYKGNDSIVFVSNKGDTGIFKGTGNYDYYHTITQAAGSRDCPDWYTAYEVYETRFKGNVFDITLSIYVSKVEPWNDNWIAFYTNNSPVEGIRTDSLFINFDKPNESLFVGNQLISGTYLDNNKRKVLMNKSLGVLKFVDTYYNLTWIKVY